MLKTAAKRLRRSKIFKFLSHYWSIKTLDRGLLPKDLLVTRTKASTRKPTPNEEALAMRDLWFFNHQVKAASQVMASLGLQENHASNTTLQILDVGCGDGIMALGVCKLTGAEVTGCDLTRAFDTLPDRAVELLGPDAIPEGLKFVQSQSGQTLPFPDNSFDCVYSWSVFEHVENPTQLLKEIFRILKPSGQFFLQIKPLYYSPWGSHLHRLIQEPWAHLLTGDEDFQKLALSAKDNIRETEKDILYRKNEFEAVKQYLLNEYKSLNRLRTHELVNAVKAVGLMISHCELSQPRHPRPPKKLLQKYSHHDLSTNEIRLFIKKPN